MQKAKPLLVVISGAIAAGKSTFVKRLCERSSSDTEYSTAPIYEPVGVWQKSGMLERFYKAIGSDEISAAHKEAEACIFQIHAFDTRVDNITKAMGANMRSHSKDGRRQVYISERYMYDDMFFWELQCKNGSVAPQIEEMYQGLHSKWKRLIPMPDLVVYLKTPHENLMRRLKERGRGEEASASLGTYQKNLVEIHEKYLSTATPGMAVMQDGETIPCVDIDGRKPFHKDDAVVDELWEKIKGALEKLPAAEGQECGGESQ